MISNVLAIVTPIETDEVNIKSMLTLNIREAIIRIDTDDEMRIIAQ